MSLLADGGAAPPECSRCGRGITPDEGCEWRDDDLCWQCLDAEVRYLRAVRDELIAALQKIANSQPRRKRNHGYNYDDIDRLQRIARLAVASINGG